MVRPKPCQDRTECFVPALFEQWNQEVPGSGRLPRPVDKNEGRHVRESNTAHRTNCPYKELTLEPVRAESWAVPSGPGSPFLSRRTLSAGTLPVFAAGNEV